MTVVAIPLRSGQLIDGFAIVDARDAFPLLSKRWNLAGGYAVQAPPTAGCSGAMHRQILGLAPGDRIVHHVNEDKLDNRRANLEVYATRSEANSRPHPFMLERACEANRRKAA